jgi:tryptophanyl-tRNA synthetase
MKKTVLTGIQSSGIPHLGNLLGAIIPAIEMSKDQDKNGLFFIADYHALTSLKNKDILQENIYSVVAAWLAFGLDIEKNIFFKQSDVIEVMELAWNLACFTPVPMLQNAHSYKDKAENLADVNAGLFMYPTLMAADILLYDVHEVPVGKDQKQHLEITRDIASKFNHHYKQDFFVLPDAVINESVMLVPGTDGRKMSKSYGNTVNLFQSDKQLKKNINAIITDSTPLEAPKDPNTCNVFAIYSLIAEKAETDALRKKYLAGNFGFGHAKTALLELVMDKFATERAEYSRYINDKAELLRVLDAGASRARELAQSKIAGLRQLTGYTL